MVLCTYAPKQRFPKTPLRVFCNLLQFPSGCALWSALGAYAYTEFTGMFELRTHYQA